MEGWEAVGMVFHMPGHSGSKELLIIVRDAYALSEDASITESVSIPIILTLTLLQLFTVETLKVFGQDTY